MLEYIELTNWKTHGSSTLRFQKGVNVLIGLMGAGKSSVMDAISFALFGTFPALKHKRVKTSDMVRNVPDEHDFAEVKLGFDSEGDRYVVGRRIPKSGVATARLEKNGEPFQTQPTKVTEEIEGILKIDYDTFSRAIYSEQNNLSYFLDLMKGDRKRQIDSMLGLDHFAVSEEYTTTMLNSIRTLISGEEQGLAQADPIAVKEQVAALTKERTALADAQAKLKQEADAVIKEVSSAEKELKRIREDYLKRKKIEEELTALSSRIAILESEIKKIEGLGIDEHALEKELDNIVADQKSAEGKAKTITAEVRKLEEGLARATEEGKAAAKRIKLQDETRTKLSGTPNGGDKNTVKAKMELSSKSIRELNEKLASLRSAKAEATKWAAELRKHFDTCPLCGNKLSEELKSRLMSEKEKAVEGSEKEMGAVSSEIESRNAELERLEKEHREILMLEEKLNEYKSAERDADAAKTVVGRLGAEREVKHKELDATNAKLKEAGEKAAQLNAKKDSALRRKEYEAEVSKSRARIANAQDEIAKINASEELMYSAQERLRTLSSRASEMKSSLEGNDKYLSGLDGQISDKTSQLNEISKAKDRIEKRRELLGEMNKFKNALVDTEASLRGMLVSSINDMMHGLWPELYPYGDYEGIRLEAAKDDYVLEARRGGNGGDSWVPIDTIASGGERSVASLALRIAMSMVIVPNLRILMLDEPTHNIDSAGMDKMISVLTETLPNIVEQIFVITHDETLKQIGMAKVYMLDRDKGANGPTVVSEV